MPGAQKGNFAMNVLSVFRAKSHSKSKVLSASCKFTAGPSLNYCRLKSAYYIM
jgi:hypothetical protein